MRKKAVTECESPELHLSDDGGWRTSCKIWWACGDKLRELFQLGRAKRIVFVAKSRPDSSTYEVSFLGRSGRFLFLPVEAYVLAALRTWLRDQIAEGRPHVGVRILTGRRP